MQNIEKMLAFGVIYDQTYFKTTFSHSKIPPGVFAYKLSCSRGLHLNALQKWRDDKEIFHLAELAPPFLRET